jgi:hypothetical protein
MNKLHHFSAANCVVAETLITALLLGAFPVMASANTNDVNFGTVSPLSTGAGSQYTYDASVQPGQSFTDILQFTLTHSATVNAFINGTAPYSPISFNSLTSSTGTLFGIESHAYNGLTTDYNGIFPDPVFGAGTYSFTFTGSLSSTNTAAADYVAGINLKSVAAPELDSSSTITAITLLSACLALLLGRRKTYRTVHEPDQNRR